MSSSYLISGLVILATFIVCRVFIKVFKQKTVTQFLRNEYKWDVHHIHLGMILLICGVFLSWDAPIVGISPTCNLLIIILESVGIGLILDEFFSFIFSVPYFNKKEFYPTLALIIVLCGILIALGTFN